MSRKLSYNITRFDGGMTDDLRTGDLSKCAYVSHFDIYCDKNKLVPMPGYTVDQDTVAGGANDLQTYNIEAFFYDGTLFGIGRKSNGTGSKMFEKATAETAEWTASTTGEGTDDLSAFTTLFKGGSRYYFVTKESTTTYLSYYAGTTTDKAKTLQSFLTTTPIVAEKYITGGIDWALNNAATDVDTFLGTTFSNSAKTTSLYVRDLEAGDEQLGIFGHNFYPYEAVLLLWDGESLLADQKVEFGKGRGMVLGNPSGTWIGIVDENVVDDNTTFQVEANGEHNMAIKYASPSGARTLLRVAGVTDTNGVIKPTRSTYRDAMTFYARIPADATPTTYKEGIWAVGRCKDNSPLAVSILLDTTTLGLVEGYYSFGHHHYFAHNEDGSVSRLSPKTGTYDITAVYESLFFGHDDLNKKNFNGMTIHTEDLPAGATIVAKYRFDSDDTWLTLGTSSDDGLESHSFTKKEGEPLGTFQEIQFRLEVLGNVAVKGIDIELTALDSIPY